MFKQDTKLVPKSQDLTYVGPPFECLKKFMISFFNNGVRVWNNLSDFVKNSNKIKEFKNKIKNWLLHNDI